MLRLGRAFGRVRLGRAAVLGMAVGLLVASRLGRLAEARLTKLLLTQAAERAVDQAQLVVVQQVTAADLPPPFDSAKLARVEAAPGAATAPGAAAGLRHRAGQCLWPGWYRADER